MTEFFPNTSSKIGGIGLDEISREVGERHRRAFPDRPTVSRTASSSSAASTSGGVRVNTTCSTLETVYRLQHSTRTKRYDIFKQYTELVDNQSEQLATIRGLLKFKPVREPISIDDVEPVSEIVKRFATGAMSYGSISAEAHETLAIAV
ncbi:MAG: glutamate synthase-related protein [Acidimicrobiales bacterium]